MKDNIKQDINFIEHPLWFQDIRADDDGRGFVWTDIEGYEFRAGYRMPSKTDYIFLLAILHISQADGWKIKLETTRSQVLSKAGLKRSKRLYSRLEESLERWKFVGVKFEGTFFEKGEYKTLSFGVIDSWGINEDTKKLEVWLNEHLLIKIKNSKYYKLIDFEELKKLKSPLNVRLYEILSKTFFRRDTWHIDAHKLADKIPMVYRCLSDITAKLKPSIKRINSQTDLKVSMEIEHQGRGKANMIFKKLADKPKEAEKPKEGSVPPLRASNKLLDELSDEIKAELRARAVDALPVVLKRKEAAIKMQMLVLFENGAAQL